MKKWIIVLIFAGFIACSQKEVDELPPKQQSVENFELSVPGDFTWSAVLQDVVLVNFVTDSSKTFALDGTPVELYNQDNELLDALTIHRGKACFNIRIPMEISTLKFRLPAINSELEFSTRKRSLNYDIPEFSEERIKQTDRDKDGLIDQFDVAPNDPQVTLKIENSNSPWSSYYIFEDLWPTAGDFDFNDFIVKTDFSVTRGKDNFITEISGVYSAEWKNAEFGLGFELMEAKGAYLIYQDDIIEEISGAEMEKSMHNGIVVLNEVKSSGKVTQGFSLNLKERCMTDFNLVPYLFRLKEKEHQVRPFGTPPTQKQQMQLFQSGDDASPNKWKWLKGEKFKYPQQGKNAFYRTNESLPWGVQFMAKSFTTPAELQTIMTSYPKFQSWAESGGTNDKDWYNHPSNQ